MRDFRKIMRPEISVFVKNGRKYHVKFGEIVKNKQESKSFQTIY